MASGGREAWPGRHRRPLERPLEAVAPAAAHRADRRSRARVVAPEGEAAAEVEVGRRELQRPAREVDGVAEEARLRGRSVRVSLLALLRELLLHAGRGDDRARRRSLAGRVVDRVAAEGDPLGVREAAAPGRPGFAIEARDGAADVEGARRAVERRLRRGGAPRWRPCCGRSATARRHVTALPASVQRVQEGARYRGRHRTGARDPSSLRCDARWLRRARHEVRRKSRARSPFSSENTVDQTRPDSEIMSNSGEVNSVRRATSRGLRLRTSY